MNRLQIRPKLPLESRNEYLDVSSAITGGITLSSAVASIIVYSGNDPSPAAILGTPVVDPTYNLITLPLLSQGVAGTIYLITITVVLQDALSVTSFASFTTFLTVISDPL
jgi:hypothetical protein